MTTAEPATKQFAIFRACDAREFEETAVMETAPLTEIEMAGAVAVAEAGVAAGSRLRLLLEAPGMSLTHVWFKSGYPLPRHSHDADCLYYIVAGSLRLGTEELGAGDGFLIGANVPYTYTPGEAGVELLEFRTSGTFDIKLMANNPAFWAKAVETVTAKREVWTEEAMPGR